METESAAGQMKTSLKTELVSTLFICAGSHELANWAIDSATPWEEKR